MSHAVLVLASTASRLRIEAMQRLAEISDHGCEAASARSFEEGRLSVLDALGFQLLPGWPVKDTDEVIQKRRRELDEALRPGATGEQMAFEPIVRRYPDNMQRLVHHRPACSLRDPEAHGSAAMTCTCDYYTRVMTEPESTEATEAEEAAVEEPADEGADTGDDD